MAPATPGKTARVYQPVHVQSASDFTLAAKSPRGAASLVINFFTVSHNMYSLTYPEKIGSPLMRDTTISAVVVLSFAPVVSMPPVAKTV
ncbi:hypothetical protein DT73_18130 [Mangrovibacter sp. MFB070]|uniref:hypothetical protein n=1 Tax=Mangrovibacter sp. MFB070 TaxID=1224318 RepID=UPI0004D81527|nr:hypothetical protein [Mangrovibacter sp. MFB070]KEA51282.1 hypothetical protein DT73_18130 [Mangrovibacter sp. MFB070]